MTTQEMMNIEAAIPGAVIFAHEETAHYPYKHSVIVIEVVTEDQVDFWAVTKNNSFFIQKFISNPWVCLSKGAFTDKEVSRLLN